MTDFMIFMLAMLIVLFPFFMLSLNLTKKPKRTIKEAQVIYLNKRNKK